MSLKSNVLPLTYVVPSHTSCAAVVYLSVCELDAQYYLQVASTFMTDK